MSFILSCIILDIVFSLEDDLVLYVDNWNDKY